MGTGGNTRGVGNVEDITGAAGKLGAAEEGADVATAFASLVMVVT